MADVHSESATHVYPTRSRLPPPALPALASPRGWDAVPIEAIRASGAQPRWIFIDRIVLRDGPHAGLARVRLVVSVDSAGKSRTVTLRLGPGALRGLVRALVQAARETWPGWDPRLDSAEPVEPAEPVDLDRAAAREDMRDDELPRRGGLAPRRPGVPRGRVQP